MFVNKAGSHFAVLNIGCKYEAFFPNKLELYKCVKNFEFLTTKLKECEAGNVPLVIHKTAAFYSFETESWFVERTSENT